MDKKVERYEQLKQQQKAIELELSELRNEIIRYCEAQGTTDLRLNEYQVKLVHQDRKEYDDLKLYQALPDPEVWRLLSKADTSKVKSLIKLNVISEDTVRDTFTVKRITLVQVDKK